MKIFFPSSAERELKKRKILPFLHFLKKPMTSFFGFALHLNFETHPWVEKLDQDKAGFMPQN